MSDFTALENHDLRPTTEADRHWTWVDYASLWIGMAHNIPTWIMAGSLIALGLTWWQAVMIVALGNLIVLVPILLNSHAGTKYGIPFPVLIRAPFGTKGALLPTIIRGLVAAAWFGIQTHVGGRALKLLLFGSEPQAADGPLGQSPTDWLCFLLFLGMNLIVVKRGMHALKRFEWFAAPTVLLLAIGLCIWSYQTAGGWGPIVEAPHRPSDKPMSELLIGGLMSVIGFWATLSLNASDFTRFARSQKDQVVGQVLGMPTTMLLFSLLGVITTSATAVIFGKVVWDPTDLVTSLPTPALSAVCLVGIILATLSVNIPANLVSAAYDVSNLWPRKIDLWRGALVTAVVATAIMPWRLLSSAEVFIFDWLGNCATVLAPVAGILVADYWLVRKKTLNVPDLYRPDGVYSYTNGFNLRAYAAFGLGVFLAYIGVWVPALAFLHEINWVTGFTTALLAYWGLSRTR